MILKKIYAFLFLFLVAVQFVPVTAIGEIISSNFLSEEIQENGTQLKLLSLEEDKLPATIPHYHYPDCDTVVYNIDNTLSYHLHDEALIKCYHLEVLLRPPNA